MGIVVGIGEVLWDMLPQGSMLGGAPANFAYHINALGGQGCLISRVGGDLLGEQALEVMTIRGLETDYVDLDPEHSTGTVVVELDDKGTASYVFPPDVAWDFLEPGEASMDIALKSTAICFGTLAQRSPVSRRFIRAFLLAAPPDALRVFDVNLRGDFYSQKIIEESMELVNVLKVSDDELLILSRMLTLKGDDREKLSALVGRYELRLAALTRGARGSLLVTADDWDDHPGSSVYVEDTIGAGDSFTAALTLGLLAGWDLESINERANVVAAAVCAQAGGMPTLRENLRIIP